MRYKCQSYVYISSSHLRATHLSTHIFSAAFRRRGKICLSIPRGTGAEREGKGGGSWKFPLFPSTHTFAGTVSSRCLDSSGLAQSPQILSTAAAAAAATVAIGVPLSPPRTTTYLWMEQTIGTDSMHFSRLFHARSASPLFLRRQSHFDTHIQRSRIPMSNWRERRGKVYQYRRGKNRSKNHGSCWKKTLASLLSACFQIWIKPSDDFIWHQM